MYEIPNTEWYESYFKTSIKPRFLDVSFIVREALILIFQSPAWKFSGFNKFIRLIIKDWRTLNAERAIKILPIPWRGDSLLFFYILVVVNSKINLILSRVIDIDKVRLRPSIQENKHELRHWEFTGRSAIWRLQSTISGSSQNSTCR